MKKFAFLAVVTTAFVSGCAYQAPTNVSPSYKAYNNYGSKVPASVAVFVEVEKMKKVVNMTGFACSAHSFPVDARNAMKTSIIKTVENVVENVVEIPAPISVADLKARNLDAVLIARVDDYDVDLTVIPGFWTATMDGDAEIVIDLAVEGTDGRLTGGSVIGRDDFKTDSGVACAGGATAVGKSTEKAMERVLTQLGERVANSQRLRDAVAAK